jgi:hypothetical protein
MNIGPNTTFVLVNHSAGADVTPEWMEKCAAAIDHKLQHAWKAVYGGNNRCRAGSPTLGPDEVAVSLEGSSDVPGAGGYHTDEAVFCFRDGASSLDSGDFAFSVIIDHEINEANRDPGANQWAFDGTGTMFAIETNDAVEGFSYPSPVNGVALSDFLYPSFFDPSGKAPYSHLGKPTAPFTTAPDNGADYQIALTVDENGENQVTAIGNVHASRLKAKSHPSSRSSRRGVKFVVSDADSTLKVDAQE